MITRRLELDRISKDIHDRAANARAARQGQRLRQLRLVERMDRLVIDGGGAVSPSGEERGDAVPKGNGQ